LSTKFSIEESSDGYKRIYGYDKYLPRWYLKRRRALLDYLAQPVLDQIEGKQIIRFSNSGIVLSWAQVLNQLGYIVDVINWDDRGFSPKEDYDLVVFHGGKNFDSIYKKINNKPQTIYFSSGSYWKFSNTREDKRIKDFMRRHGTKIERDRYVYDSEDPVNTVADGIIVLGDPSMKDTYPKEYTSIFTINNASYPDEHFTSAHKTKDYDKARKNFLFFAGSGNIHKGLDLLIDAFKDLDANLYIMTAPDKKVMAVFKSELKQSNIHMVGEVPMRTEKFYEIVDKCAYVILPSCSEGQAGSVVECMNQGLIPIVSKETRLDATDYGVVLNNNSISMIKRTVIAMAQLDCAKVKKMAEITREVALREHSAEKFRKNLKKTIRGIITAT